MKRVAGFRTKLVMGINDSVMGGSGSCLGKMKTTSVSKHHALPGKEPLHVHKSVER